jgi:hypothetical protein
MNESWGKLIRQTVSGIGPMNIWVVRIQNLLILPHWTLYEKKNKSGGHANIGTPPSDVSPDVYLVDTLLLTNCPSILTMVE